MKWITHQAGALVGALVLQADPAFTAAMICGAVVPDLVEHVLSRGKRAIFFRIHRGFFHWFGLYALLLIPAHTLSLPLSSPALPDGVLLGALSHLALDSLNPMGIPLLPFFRSPRLSFHLCSTGSLGEWCLLGGFFLVICLGGSQIDPAWLRRLMRLAG